MIYNLNPVSKTSITKKNTNKTNEIKDVKYKQVVNKSHMKTQTMTVRNTAILMLQAKNSVKALSLPMIGRMKKLPISPIKIIIGWVISASKRVNIKTFTLARKMKQQEPQRR